MCGIIGVFTKSNAAELAMLGMFAEQHRGQESCGIAVNNGRVFKLKKKMGLVKQVFTPEVLEQMQGAIAVGHVRYPTCGSATEFNSQPHIVETLSGPSYALASNGDIINYKEVRDKLESEGVYFASDNDGELLLKHLIWNVEKNNKTITEAIRLLMKEIKGAYSSVLATRYELYMFRDPCAIRPMVWGKSKDGSVIAASESCALDIIGVENQEEVQAAEIIVVNNRGIEKIKNNPDDYRDTNEPKHCIFEHIYFSRPDSIDFGENVYSVREKIGEMLAENDDLVPDMVIPVPDSANFIADGYAKKKNVPFQFGLIRNHYVGRTFIKPEQTIRDESVSQKFNVLPNLLKGKKIVLIDDSIVRGTTIRKLVKLIRKAGVTEVHLRIGSPQVKYSCYYGIDTPSQTELIANTKELDEIISYLKVDSLVHISLADLKKCVKKPTHFCSACFDGLYPVK